MQFLQNVNVLKILKYIENIAKVSLLLVQIEIILDVVALCLWVNIGLCKHATHFTVKKYFYYFPTGGSKYKR